MKVDFETDVGAVRSSNQDACDGGLFSKDSAWAVVCDGMIPIAISVPQLRMEPILASKVL